MPYPFSKDLYKVMNTIQHCSNCGLPGHLFRNCVSPVMSYGIIAMRSITPINLFSPRTMIPPGTFQLLFIQRKYTLFFVEFIRGKYHVQDESYLITMLEGMTHSEHEMIRTMTFPALWTALWGEASDRRNHRNEYELSDRRFAAIAASLPQLMKDHPAHWDEPEWGFPKGRRNPHETDVNCAMREFQEETGLGSMDYTLFQNTLSLSESFYGSNMVRYSHQYYLGMCHGIKDIHINHANPYMIKEVRDIQWFTIEEAMAKIRPDNMERQELLWKISKILKNFHPISVNDHVRLSQRKSMT